MQVQIEPTPVFADVQGVRCRIWQGHSDNGAEVFLCVAALCVQELPYLDRDGNPVPRPRLSPNGYRAELVDGDLVLTRKELAK